MAKIKPIAIIESMSGKVCTHSDTYFATNKQTGKVHTGMLCYPNHGPLTEAQKEVQRKFAALAAAVKDWMAKNPEGSALYKQEMRLYRAQHEVGTFRGWISRKLSKDGSIAPLPEQKPSGNEGTSGSDQNPNPNPGQGGGTTQPGGGGDEDGGGSGLE